MVPQNRGGTGGQADIGQQLRLLRAKEGLSQRQVAQKIGVSLWRYWRIETLVCEPRPDELSRLQAVLVPEKAEAR